MAERGELEGWPAVLSVCVCVCACARARTTEDRVTKLEIEKLSGKVETVSCCMGSWVDSRQA